MTQQPDTEFPNAIGKVAKRELAANGYTKFPQLTKTTPKELLTIHGLARRCPHPRRGARSQGLVLGWVVHPIRLVRFWCAACSEVTGNGVPSFDELPDTAGP